MHPLFTSDGRLIHFMDNVGTMGVRVLLQLYLRSLLEMQTLWPHPRAISSESVFSQDLYMYYILRKLYRISTVWVKWVKEVGKNVCVQNIYIYITALLFCYQYMHSNMPQNNTRINPKVRCIDFISGNLSW